MESVKILLFISKESAVYQFVRHQVEAAVEKAFGKKIDPVLEVIDIAENPELAESYNIEALPTICVGDRRFIGTPTPEVLATCLSLAVAPVDLAAPKRE